MQNLLSALRRNLQISCQTATTTNQQHVVHGHRRLTPSNHEHTVNLSRALIGCCWMTYQPREDTTVNVKLVGLTLLVILKMKVRNRMILIRYGTVMLAALTVVQ